ncbi:MAG: PKD domain-containing protein [Caldilineaceae bacterium]
MQPRLPLRIALPVMIFFALFTAILLGSDTLFPTAQAQVGSFNSIEAGRAAAPSDLTVNVIHSRPTYRGETVTLTATVNITDVSGLTFAWNFGDGNTGTGQVVRHTYATVGNFVARVVVSDGGQPIIASATLNVIDKPTVEPPPPGKVSITILNPPPWEAQRAINFLATVDNGSNVEFTWNFGDGSAPETGSAASHEYALPGRYTIQVVARNDRGTSSGTKSIEIVDATPEGLTFDYEPRPAQIGENMLFTAAVERGTNVSYSWYISDGTSRAGKTISHQFTEPKEYELRVVAANKSGSTEYSRTIFVRTRPPDGIRLLQDSPQNVGDLVHLFLSVNSRAAVTFQIDWGDGKSTRETVRPERSGQRNYQLEVTHTYEQVGKYPLVVTAMNGFGFVDMVDVIYIQLAKQPQTLNDYTEPTLPLPHKPSIYTITEPDVAQYICDWVVYDPIAREDDGKAITYRGANIEHQFQRSGAHVVSILCVTSDGQTSKTVDFVVRVSYPSYLPLIAQKNKGTSNPGRVGEATPTSTPTATATPTETSTVTPTETPTHTMTPVPPTATPIRPH